MHWERVVICHDLTETMTSLAAKFDQKVWEGFQLETMQYMLKVVSRRSMQERSTDAAIG